MTIQDPFSEGDLGALPPAEATIGHNRPPAGEEKLGLAARLERENVELIKRATTLEAEAKKVPAEIDASTEVAVTDLVALTKAAAKELDSRRETIKAPYLEGGRIVDGFFGAPRDRLKAMAADIERKLGRWLKVKAENERRAREEAEALERAAAARKFEEAVKAQEAETAATTAQAAAQAALVNAALDLGEARKAVAAAEQEYRLAKSLRDAAQASGDGAAYQAAANRMTVAEAAGKAARARANELADQVAAAEVRERQAIESAQAASRSAAEKLDQATAAEDSAAKIGQTAHAPLKDLSRTRGNYGLSGLVNKWTFDGFDREKLDLEALRQHLPEEAVKSAIRSYIAAGGRNLRGVSIYEEARAVVR